MKKFALIFTSLLFLLLTVRVSFADEDTTASPFRVRKDAIQEKRETVRENLKTNMEDAKKRMAANREENIKKYLSKMIARLEAMVARLEKLIARIESRLQKIATENPEKDLTSIKAQLEKAKTLLMGASDKISELKTTGDSLVDSDNPKAVFDQIRTKLNSIKKDLVEVHRILVKVIGDIKGLRVGENKNETE